MGLRRSDTGACWGLVGPGSAAAVAVTGQPTSIARNLGFDLSLVAVGLTLGLLGIVKRGQSVAVKELIAQGSRKLAVLVVVKAVAKAAVAAEASSALLCFRKYFESIEFSAEANLFATFTGFVRHITN